MLIFKNLAADSVVLEKQSASINFSSPSANRWVLQRWSGPCTITLTLKRLCVKNNINLYQQQHMSL